MGLVVVELALDPLSRGVKVFAAALLEELCGLVGEPLLVFGGDGFGFEGEGLGGGGDVGEFGAAGEQAGWVVHVVGIMWWGSA